MHPPVRALKAALNSHGKFRYKLPEFSVDYLVIGGGVVGLAIARQLCRKFTTKATYLVERHPSPGQETSSRNSEVIHSGLYYPPDSFKTRFCLRGRQMMYAYCQSFGVDHKKTGKLVVACANEQQAYIESLYKKAHGLTPPKYFDTGAADPVLPISLISGREAREMEPNLSTDVVGALWSPETGIIDSHGLMRSFERDIAESGGAGELVYSTEVVRIDRASSGWDVQLLTGADNDTDAIHTHTLINAAGLSAPYVLNGTGFLSEEEYIPMYFARGSYASYTGPGVSGISHLIYPCPDATLDGLGTHLTLDLQGKVRFGPDVQWVSPPNNKDMEFWKQHLIPDEKRLGKMHEAIEKYLPGVRVDGMGPDYVGLRPKIAAPGMGFRDFVIRREEGMINLLGIESPGLTSCMAIAEHITEDLLDG